MFCSHFPRVARISKLKKALISVDKGEETEDSDDNCGDDDNDDDGGDNQRFFQDSIAVPLFNLKRFGPGPKRILENGRMSLD